MALSGHRGSPRPVSTASNARAGRADPVPGRRQQRQRTQRVCRAHGDAAPPHGSNGNGRSSSNGSSSNGSSNGGYAKTSYAAPLLPPQGDGYVLYVSSPPDVVAAGQVPTVVMPAHPLRTGATVSDLPDLARHGSGGLAADDPFAGPCTSGRLASREQVARDAELSARNREQEQELFALRSALAETESELADERRRRESEAMQSSRLLAQQDGQLAELHRIASDAVAERDTLQNEISALRAAMSRLQNTFASIKAHVAGVLSSSMHDPEAAPAAMDKALEVLNTSRQFAQAAAADTQPAPPAGGVPPGSWNGGGSPAPYPPGSGVYTNSGQR